jgi:hypothetical protein
VTLCLYVVERMKQADVTNHAAASALRRWWRRIADKPAGEVALDAVLFVLGIVVLYVIDLTVISRGAPVACRYMLDFLVYLDHHAVAAVQTLY